MFSPSNIPPPQSSPSLPLGEHALQVLPALVDGIPEARLNLVVYHLRHDAVNEAYELVRDLEPTTPQVGGWSLALLQRTHPFIILPPLLLNYHPCY